MELNTSFLALRAVGDDDRVFKIIEIMYSLDIFLTGLRSSSALTFPNLYSIIFHAHASQITKHYVFFKKKYTGNLFKNHINLFLKLLLANT